MCRPSLELPHAPKGSQGNYARPGLTFHRSTFTRDPSNCTICFILFILQRLHILGCLYPSFADKFDPGLHLSVDDYSVDSPIAPCYLRVRIKSSKTDPFRQGCFIYIGRGSSSICAVCAFLYYLSLRGNRSGPLFMLHTGQPLTRQLVTTRLRSILHSARVPGNFRIGAATKAAKMGIPTI